MNMHPRYPGFVKPFFQSVEHGNQLLPRRLGQRLHPTIEPITELFVTKPQYREDQILLRTKVLVHRRLRDAGFGNKHVHAGRLKAVPIERLQRLLHQFVSFSWPHIESLYLPICT